MKKNITLALLILFISGCNQSKQFEKIIFHSSGCFGTCPVYHLELDSDKTFKLYSELVYKNKQLSLNHDTAKMGYFTGIVPDSSFKKLSTIIQHIDIETLNFGDEMCCDAPVINIIVYRNGKRIYLKSMFPPEKAKGMIDELYDICASGTLKRADKPFKIEDEANYNRKL